jgi:hypothetical protein
VGVGILVLSAIVPCAFVIAGLRAWLLRVELAAFDADDVLTMTWVQWPRARRVVSLSLSDVRHVALQSNDEGSERLALIATSQRLPLTASFTADDLEPKARDLQRFLGLAERDGLARESASRPAR